MQMLYVCIDGDFSRFPFPPGTGYLSSAAIKSEWRGKRKEMMRPSDREQLGKAEDDRCRVEVRTSTSRTPGHQYTMPRSKLIATANMADRLELNISARKNKRNQKKKPPTNTSRTSLRKRVVFSFCLNTLTKSLLSSKNFHTLYQRTDHNNNKNKNNKWTITEDEKNE
ncbi:conserved hypothetical protein [Trichinella spiralis]|uniref:hypothetical protein n=1 Tax=Trichinella spiralis TaxID=6334 RepID=UPI0001EFEE52|nr:conserved hypothetical protein [Trichinella spiralis]